MLTTSPIDSIKQRVTIGEMARMCGLYEGRGATWGCPACRADKRSSKGDARGSIGTRTGGAGWKCHRCGVAGDVVDLVAYRVTGARLKDLSTSDTARVFSWCADRGLCERRGSGEVVKVDLRPLLPPSPPAA